MTILSLLNDVFTWKVLVVFHYWSYCGIIPVALALYYGSKSVGSCNDLMISVVKIANQWDDEEVLNRV